MRSQPEGIYRSRGAAVSLGVAVAVGLIGAAPNALADVPGRGMLPDNRGYEMVSPSEKNGTDVWGTQSAIYGGSARSSASGQRVLFASAGPFADPRQAYAFVTYTGTRASTQWVSESASPPLSPSPNVFNLSGTQGFSEDLSATVLNNYDPPLVNGAQLRTVNLYRRNTETGAYALLTPSGPSDQFSVSFYKPIFAAGSRDFSHIIYESTHRMTPDAVDGVVNLYEWADGQNRLVGIRPDDSPAPAGSAAGPQDPIYGPGASAQSYTQTTMSSDGSRIFWTDLSDNQVYLREDGNVTIHVSETQRTNDSGPGGSDPSGPQPATFQLATPDGSKVFFTSTEKLTNDATADASGRPAADLYAYDVDSGSLTDLSVDTDPGESADVLGVIGVSDDGSYVYFVARGALAPGAQQGEANAYMWHAGTLRYIATLDGSPTGGDLRNIASNPQQYGGPKSSRVAPSGEVVLLSSVRSLTGYDNAGHVQLYRYDATADDLQCISCDPSGSPATSDATTEAPIISGPFFQPFLTRTLSADGQRIFFHTGDALVQRDTNGRVDVYEWYDGEIHLLTTGQSNDDSYFADASASGDDVFFVTRERLVSADRDSNVDLYDARVDGGFEEPPAPRNCSGDDCQGPVPAPPENQRPGSATVFGLGNDGSEAPAKRRARFSIVPISPQAKRAFARTGRLKLTLRVSSGGLAKATATARLGGRTRTVASSRKRGLRAGVIQMTLVLSRTARQHLASTHRLRVRIRVTYSRAAAPRVATIVLDQPTTGRR